MYQQLLSPWERVPGGGEHPLYPCLSVFIRGPMCFSACLPLQILERLFDFVFGFGCGRYQWQARRTTVVAVQVHRILEAGDAVLRRDQRRSAADAVLPVQAGSPLAGLLG